jgi:uncharacterized Ntn-hydrolase superfamily protein
MINQQINDILNRRGVKYTINGNVFYTEESVVSALTEVLEQNGLLTEQSKLLQFMIDNGLGEEDLTNDI